LKDILTGAPILKITDLDEDFVMCTDACKEGLDEVLSKKDHVVCYESQKLKENERNYATHDLESTIIVHALKMWRHYLMGRRFELRRYLYGLKHSFGQPILNARQTRWLKFLSEYDFEIKHIKGKENQVVDALDRRVHEVRISAISMFNTDLKDKILEAANLHQQYLKIKETL
jgi:HD-like signal output (HDOD) protein